MLHKDDPNPNPITAAINICMDRARQQPRFQDAMKRTVAAVAAATKGKSVEEMRALGGFTALLKQEFDRQIVADGGTDQFVSVFRSTLPFSLLVNWNDLRVEVYKLNHSQER